MDLAIDNLASKILCKRHNEALSPLDAEAGSFFRSLTEALADLERSSTSRKPNFHLASGTALEYWMLKVACGMYFSIAAKDKVRLSETHTIDLIKIRRAFFEGIWDDRGGLYFKGHIGSAMTTAWSVVVSPLSDDAAKIFSGVRIALLGLELELLFDTTNVNQGPWTGIIRRPTELIFEKGGREHHIILTWPAGTPENGIHLSDEPPPGVARLPR
ncbi:hypothetical protein [Bradyrhizobium sp. AZCC 2262]|uniref:hypothetical protein n=1 Tax=Bradyrhizobium sp. AZCC 2262 TaxID=3117022 RepID=UPI002FF0F841